MAAMTFTVLPEDSEVRDGRLLVGGCDAVELARELGTPAYVVAEEDLRGRARAFQAALAAHHDGPGEVVFASKAFPCTAVLRVFAEEGLSVDVASGGELHLALRAGFDPERIYLHGNAKSHSELAAALDCGVGHVVVDNFEDIDRLEALAREPQRILIRVTPGVEAATHAKIATGQHDSKFGFTMADAVEAVARAEGSDLLDLAGLHMHIGSQLFDLQPYRAAVKVLATLGDFGTYDLGGGLGAPYTAADRPLAPEDWVAGLATTLRERVGPGKKLLLEPGRALVANAGVTLYRVETVKRGTRIWVGVDGGMSDNLRPMLYGAAYEVHVADRFGYDGEPCTIVGKHCESGDVLAEDVHLPPTRPGDVLVMPGTGAYGHAMANNYNGVPRPPVVFVGGGRARVVVRRETFEDLEHRDVA
jgi:diaminopimelate decarboxylase